MNSLATLTTPLMLYLTPINLLQIPLYLHPHVPAGTYVYPGSAILLVGNLLPEAVLRFPAQVVLKT
jgi:hypothetical protein